MSLTDMVIMPGADYLDACNAIREKTGSSAAIKSGELGGLIRGISGGGAEPRLQSKYVSPRVAAQTVTPDTGYDGLSAVTVQGDPNLIPQNIASGVVIFGVVGTHGDGVDTSDHSVEDSIVTSSITQYVNDRVTTVGVSAFQGQYNLASVSFPRATSVAGSAFSGCTKLSSVYIPLVTDVYINAFYGCTALTRLDLPSVTNIIMQAFGSCSALTAVILRNKSAVCTLGNANAFKYTPIESGTGYIYVPRALVDSYKVATSWSTYASQIRAIEDYPEITGG